MMFFFIAKKKPGKSKPDAKNMNKVEGKRKKQELYK